MNGLEELICSAQQDVADTHDQAPGDHVGCHAGTDRTPVCLVAAVLAVQGLHEPAIKATNEEVQGTGVKHLLHSVCCAGTATKPSNFPGHLALIQAAAAGDRQAVQQLITKAPGAAQQPGVLGWTALHVAAALGHIEVLQAPLAAEAQSGAQTDKGATPLRLAVEHNQLAAVQALLQAGTAVVTAGPSPANMLAIAASLGSWDIVLALVAAGAAYSTDSSGQAAMHVLAAHGDTATVQLLLTALGPAYAAVLSAVTSAAWMPLHRAAAAGHAGVVQALLTAGAHAAAVTKATATCPAQTALELAAANGHVAVLECFLQHHHAAAALDQHTCLQPPCCPQRCPQACAFLQHMMSAADCGLQQHCRTALLRSQL